VNRTANQQPNVEYLRVLHLARRLAAIAERRPLTKEEFDRLQQYLACMHMICDTPAILDPACRVCPKLEELEGVLGELLEEPARKIIIFSEWVRMLELVRELVGEMGIDCAWHTGDVPQLERRTDIARFRDDPACRVFLSSDAGATGLNLQWRMPSSISICPGIRPSWSSGSRAPGARVSAAS
jgi:SNF2 family DNA or RNA helicase